MNELDIKTIISLLDSIKNELYTINHTLKEINAEQKRTENNEEIKP